MILILGSSRDDTLFFESMMGKSREELLFSRYPVRFGRILSQDVALVSEVYTNVEASAVTLHFIEQYFVFFVINLGTCVGYSDDCPFGRIAVSKETTFLGVDQIARRSVSLGQIPQYDTYLPVAPEIFRFLNPILEERIPNKYTFATFVTSDTYFTKKEQLDPYLFDGKLLAKDKGLILDCTFGGVALACSMKKIPFLGIKVVETKFTEPMDYLRYADILKIYTDVGKVVVSAISDIGSTDVLVGDLRV